MTYGVPYSFVPGTKAKADEVNANFISVLEKIEDTNTRIDETTTSLNESIETLNSDITTEINNVRENYANTSLSNINSTALALFNAKANATDLDGNWTYKYTNLCFNKSISPSNTQSYSLTSYLPNDNNKYEIIFIFSANLENSKSYAFIDCKTDFLKTVIPVCRLGAGVDKNKYTGSIFPLIVSTGKSITINNTSYSVGNTSYTLSATAYRKVR